MPFIAGYGLVDEPATEARSFPTRDAAQAWLNTITPSLPAPIVTHHEPDDAHGEPWDEVDCSWQAWIAADDA